MKKLFGGLNITWTRLVIAAVLAGAYTALMAMLPAAKDTSFADISITFEWWILFGILIITNSKTPLESALKCMVFFLISQPLVYLIQVPFSRMGWGLFKYYPTWFAWTMFTFPMGFIGWYMRKEKWWSILPLAAMLILLAYHFGTFLNEMRLDFPHHLLSLIFVAASMIIYPLFIFENRKLKLTGLTISIVAMLGLSVITLATGRSTYNTTLLVNNGSLGVEFDDTYEFALEDEKYGDVEVVYNDNIEDWLLNASFKKTGSTRLIMTSPDGKKRYFNVTIYRDRYDITEWYPER